VNTSNLNHYEVLSPWAEIDPKTMRGISPRISELAWKKIGLFYNGKRAAHPIMNVVEQKLKERFPTVETSHFTFPENRDITGTEEEAKLKEWAKGVDAIISAVGD
jgi:hypothetical protein